MTNAIQILGLLVKIMPRVLDVISEARDLLDRARSEGRDVTDEELQELRDRNNALMDDWRAGL